MTTTSRGSAATSGLVRARCAPRRLASSGTTRRSSYPPWRVLLLIRCSFGAAGCSDPCSVNRPSRSAQGAPRPEVRSALGATEAARRAGALARLTHAPQPLHEHRVVGERLGPVDEGVEQLVVARRRHVEQLADRLLLGAGVLPPLALEGQDLALPRAQLPTQCRFLRQYSCGVHDNPPAVRRRHHTIRMTLLSFPLGPATPPKAGRGRRSRARPESRGPHPLLSLSREDEAGAAGAGLDGELQAVPGVEVEEEQALGGDRDTVAAPSRALGETDTGDHVADVQQGVR